MPEVGINYDLFQTAINHLNNSVTALESSMKTNRTFEKTNITPFTNDLENIIKAVELLNRYKQVLIQDISTLQDIGEQMKQKDEELAGRTNQVSDGPIPIRM